MTVSPPVVRMEAQAIFGRPPGCDGFFDRNVTAQVSHDPAALYLSAPFSGFGLSPHAVIAASVVPAEAAIANILDPRTASQINKSVVRSVAVDVVDVVGFFAGCKFPDDAMGKERLVVNRAMPVTVGSERTEGWFPSHLRVPTCRRAFGRMFRAREHFWASFAPSQRAGFWVILKQLAKFISTRNWFGFHIVESTTGAALFQVLAA